MWGRPVETGSAQEREYRLRQIPKDLSAQERAKEEQKIKYIYNQQQRYIEKNEKRKKEKIAERKALYKNYRNITQVNDAARKASNAELTRLAVQANEKRLQKRQQGVKKEPRVKQEYDEESDGEETETDDDTY